MGDKIEENEVMRCPKCFSEKVMHRGIDDDGYNKWDWFLCDECKHTWKE